MAAEMGFRPVKTKRAFEEVCDQIRSEIQAGRITAGDKLPSERDLAEQLQVSRATVREAFRTLEKKVTRSLIVDDGIRADGRGDAGGGHNRYGGDGCGGDGCGGDNRCDG